MKKLILSLIALSPSLVAMDFTTRFGPNSFAYNQPLYFESNHMIARPDKKKKDKKTNYREKIQKQQYKNAKKRRVITPEDLE